MSGQTEFLKEKEKCLQARWLVEMGEPVDQHIIMTSSLRAYRTAKAPSEIGHLLDK